MSRTIINGVLTELKDSEQVYLRITTWVGYLGVHYYGSLWCTGKREEIMWIPTDKYRKMLNDFERGKYGWKLKKGDSTKKFLREEDLIKEAKKQWEKIFPKAKILIKGEPFYVYDIFPDELILDKKEKRS